ncbi:MAG: SDR family oxidoreductase [Chthoniobacterales bacterium]|nr:SDR family oxidoreductase [Chthoniobacterales bacterium]
MRENVEELVSKFGADVPVYPCDVANDAEIAAFFGKVKGHTDKLDLLLHPVAFAPKEAFEGGFVSTSRQAFSAALDIGGELGWHFDRWHSGQNLFWQHFVKPHVGPTHANHFQRLHGGSTTAWHG